MKSRHIVIGLVIGFILFLFYRIGADNYSYEQPRTHSQSSIQSQFSDSSYDIDRIYNPQPSGSQSNLDRKEVLRTNVKGYREATYWGSEHPLDEEIRYQNDDEFDRFINEEVESKDADVYWGAEYY